MAIDSIDQRKLNPPPATGGAKEQTVPASWLCESLEGRSSCGDRVLREGRGMSSEMDAEMRKEVDAELSPSFSRVESVGQDPGVSVLLELREKAPRG